MEPPQKGPDSGSSQWVNQLTEKFGKYMQDSPIKMLSGAAMFWGSLLLLLFFLRIGYLPDVNFESLTSVLYAVALLGLSISVYTMLVMVMPGLFLSAARDSTDRVTAGHLLCITGGAAIIWGIAIFQMFDVWDNSLPNWVAVLGGLVVALLAPVLGILVSRKWPADAEVSEDGKEKFTPQNNFLSIYGWSLFALVVIAFLLAISIMFISVLGLDGSIRSATGSHAAWQIAVLVFLVAGSSALIASLKGPERNRITIIFAPTLMFIVLSMAGRFSTIPMISVKALGLGEISAARITVTGKTCREVNQTLGQQVCASAADEDVTAICPVMIKSRIGGQVVLDFAALADVPDADKKPHFYWVTTQGAVGEKPGKKISRRIILDKAKIIGWQPLPGINEQDFDRLPNPIFSKRVATWLDAKVKDIESRALTSATLDDFLIERCGEKIQQQSPPPEK